mmetsp:Transcript_16408/g.27297  ORF Transcript_16408/g.27297 Transcript_16408/m.27297 type:complete len:240 (-) Transcript_16408:111-830(-)
MARCNNKKAVRVCLAPKLERARNVLKRRGIRSEDKSGKFSSGATHSSAALCREAEHMCLSHCSALSVGSNRAARLNLLDCCLRLGIRRLGIRRPQIRRLQIRQLRDRRSGFELQMYVCAANAKRGYTSTARTGVAREERGFPCRQGAVDDKWTTLQIYFLVELGKVGSRHERVLGEAQRCFDESRHTRCCIGMSNVALDRADGAEAQSVTRTARSKSLREGTHLNAIADKGGSRMTFDI